MAVTNYKGSATIGTTEYYLVSASTTKTLQTGGCIVDALIDLSALAAGDQYQVTLYCEINGTERSHILGQPLGAQSGPFLIPSFLFGERWEIGVKKLAGTDRSIGWSVNKAT